MPMKIYLVGGAVRDMMLGREPKDKDYLIVGATAEDEARMVAEGYERVGADFPVYLHPVTKDEYAFARIERKTGVGYQGFTFETNGVTVEQDLARRDLTINSMAIDLETNELIDPYGGQADLKKRVLRHTTEAFAEDPLRVFRVAKFASRYNFSIAPETLELMEQIVDSGEIAHLAKERIWKEMVSIFDNNFVSSGVAALGQCRAMEYFSEDLAAKLPVHKQVEMDVIRFYDMNVDDSADKIACFIGICTDSTMTDKDFDKTLTAMCMPLHAKKIAMAFKNRYHVVTTASYLECSELEVLKKLKTLDFYGSTNFNKRFQFYAKASHFSPQWDEFVTSVFDLYAMYVKELAKIDRAGIAAKHVNGVAIRDEITAAEVAVIKRVREMSK